MVTLKFVFCLYFSIFMEIFWQFKIQEIKNQIFKFKKVDDQYKLVLRRVFAYTSNF